MCGIINLFGVTKNGMPPWQIRAASRFLLVISAKKTYMLSGALILNMVSTLRITPRTARHRAMRP